MYLKFKVNRPRLDHNGSSYGLGDPIELTAEEAEQLLKLEAVVVPSADEEAAALAQKKADEEAAQKKAQEDAAALEAQKKKDAEGANKGAAKAKD